MTGEMQLDSVMHGPQDRALEDILALIRRTYSYMDGRIDPPSSMHRLTLETIAAQCESEEVWSMGTPIVGCVFLTKKPGRLYIGKLAVDETARNRGIGRALMDLAAERARVHGIALLELEVRIELVEIHAYYARLGFVEFSRSAHAGFSAPTYLTMRRALNNCAGSL